MPDVMKRIAGCLKVGAIAAIGVGIIRRVVGTKPPEVTGQATWQPLATSAAAEKRSGPVQFTSAPAAEPESPAPTGPTADDSWVAPIDGVCPTSHPIKGNADSGIFHVPGGMSYERTVPERCYISEAEAEADGFRKSKR
jgi:hypothetical protein